MKLVAFNSFKHLDYVRSVSEVSISADTGGIVALSTAGEPIGVVLFDSWTDTAVTAHISVQKPYCLRSLHVEAFRYIFDTHEKAMILGIVASDNGKARRLNEHFGFTEIVRIPHAVSWGVDQIVYQMMRADCRYLNTLKEVA